MQTLIGRQRSLLYIYFLFYWGSRATPGEFDREQASIIMSIMQEIAEAERHSKIYSRFCCVLFLIRSRFDNGDGPVQFVVSVWSLMRLTLIEVVMLFGQCRWRCICYAYAAFFGGKKKCWEKSAWKVLINITDRKPVMTVNQSTFWEYFVHPHSKRRTTGIIVAHVSNAQYLLTGKHFHEEVLRITHLWNYWYL